MKASHTKDLALVKHAAIVSDYTVTALNPEEPTSVMIRAAELWAEVRQIGQATADPKALDGDVILAAQAQLQAEQGYRVIVATTNVKHISRFIDARLWNDI